MTKIIYYNFRLPDNTYVEVPTTILPAEAELLARKKYPDAYKGKTSTPDRSWTLDLPNGSGLPFPFRFTVAEARDIARQIYPELYLIDYKADSKSTSAATTSSQPVNPPSAQHPITTDDLLAIRIIVGVIILLTISFNRIAAKRRSSTLHNAIWVSGWLFSLSLFVGPPQQLSIGIGASIVTTVILSLLWALIGFAIGYIWRLVRLRSIQRNNSSISTESAANERTLSHPFEISTNSDDRIWEWAILEFDSDARKKGLWARCYAECDGNSEIAKAKYLRIRFAEMRDGTKGKTEK
jgi:hypothetical protein